MRSPRLRRRELGSLLRAFRVDQGLTVDQVAEHLLCSPSKVSKMETGHSAATLRDVRDLCDLYGVTDQDERDRLTQLARDGKAQGWWRAYGLPYSDYVGMEAEATSISDYDSAVVPGLLQTADYARALHEAAIPKKAPDVIEQWVAARAARQRLLHRPDPPRFHAVLDEAVLQRVIGRPEVMRAQLRRLAEAARFPTVRIQVIPYSAGAHPALDSTFNILDFGSSVPSVVYVEGLIGPFYLDRSEDVGRYRDVFDRLCTMALTPKDSIEFIMDNSLSGLKEKIPAAASAGRVLLLLGNQGE
jgi:Domain of unknown function (DUF5753)/Helix-turn-helix domain